MKNFILFTLFLCCCSSVLRGQVSGKVFQDFDVNGKFDKTQTFQDKAQSGILIEAYNAQNELLSSEKTDSEGNYTLNIPAGQRVRLVFSKLPESFVASRKGLIRFVKSPASNVDLGLYNPERFSEANPLVSIALYTNVNPADSVGKDSSMALVVVPYQKYQDGQKSEGINLAKGSEIGAVWGLAFQQKEKKIYSSAIAKRHSAYGNLGTGGIYISDLKERKTKPFINLQDFGIQTGENTHANLKTDSTGSSVDALIYKQIGKVSLGGLDISEDGKTLYVMNLYDRNLYAITNLNTTPSIKKIELPNPKYKGGEYRPFAVKCYDYKVYIGMVCDAEKSQREEDLKATVFEYNPLNKDFSKVLEIPLNYKRGFATYGSTVSKWNPWTDDFSKTILANNPSTVIYPQPILADIEFDTDGSMVLGLMDRFGHQVGAGQPDPTNTANYAGTAAGDILRCYRRKAQKFDLEANAAIGKITTEGAGNEQGPNGGEFYFQEQFSAEGLSLHEESGAGGLALIHGSNTVINTVHEPTAEYGNAGLKWFNSTDGSLKGGVALLPSDKINPFSKVNGVGDVEILSSLPNIEIGNRIWTDCDEDGIQDTDEQALSDISIELWKDNQKIATTKSDSDGEYFFNENNVKEGLQVLQNYEVRIALNKQLKLTKSISDFQEINNDALEENGYAVVKFKTGDYGQNNYAFDFGFQCSVKPTFKTTIACQTVATDVKDAKLIINGYNSTDRFSFSKGNTFTNNSEYETADLIPKGGIVLNETFSINNPQEYTLRLFNASGCFSDALITLSDKGCLNKELEDPNFIVYPNPTTEQVKVSYKGTDFSNTVTLNIYDLLGRQIIQKDLSPERNGNFQAIIDVSKYQTGSYVLSITDGQKKLGRVIVKAE